MASDLNPVEAIVSIAGNNCYVQSLKLYQGFNCHHRFEIVVDFQELDSLWFNDPEKMINMLGESVNITFKHKQTGETNEFEGIITQTDITGYQGQQGGIIIQGCSPTIKLDGLKNMDSFMDKTLQLIVDEVSGEQGNGASITCKPKYTDKIDFICQYEESAFDFLNRLSYLYGEYFYYDGKKIYFGNPMKTATADITYDIHLQNLHLCSMLVPSKSSQYEYLIHDDKEIDSPAPNVDSTLYANIAKGRSEAIYGFQPIRPVKASIITKKGLDDLVKVEKTRQVGSMHCIKGRSQTSKIKIGEGLNVSLPGTMQVFKTVGNFIVTEVTHVVEPDGRYYNEFKGIPAGTEHIPMEEPQMPVAAPQVATINTNNDEKQLGRVKVEFQWQKKKGKTTNWIRVQTPDAGKSGKVASNRGLICIPEDGDLVMIGFEYGDPNRPFVQGSMFAGKSAAGGGAGNDGISLTGKSGNTMKMNDGGGLNLIDKTKLNHIEIDGTNTITITADKIIKLVTGAVSIELNKETNKITLTAANIEIGNGKANATKIDINGDEMTSKGSTSFTVKDFKTVDITGSTSTTVKKDDSNKIVISGSVVDIDGGQVQIN